jgi:cytochrome c-type biogenesis protein
MEETFAASIISAVWLGILTSISPCPLATNIAAISFISKDVSSKRFVFWNGFLYTIGRMIAYMAIAIILVFSLTSVPDIANFLQKYINMVIGPLLILMGLLLLNVFKFDFLTQGSSFSDYIKKKAEKKGTATAFILGFLFALAFCPVSAGLFFGSLIPISLREGSGIILPLLYGLGTALPVIVFAFVIAFSAGSIGKVYNAINKFQFWAQRITGIIFIGAGIYLSYTYLL